MRSVLSDREYYIITKRFGPVSYTHLMTPGGATELMEVFGKEESIARIKKGIEKLSNN